MTGADPFVLREGEAYYLYVTGNVPGVREPGIGVWRSRDLVHWEGPVGAKNGYALAAQDSWGDRGFWAPEVVPYRGQYYMFYTVQEHLAVATARDPRGPFVQTKKEPLHRDTREIDPHVFIDDDGKKYFYFVRFDKGNVLYGAQLADDLLSVQDETTRFLLRASQPWEDLDDFKGTISEGPFVLKHKGLYYLTYSANHYQSDHYAVGYATSKHPLGPYTKSPHNPILQATDEVHGPGHHSFVLSPSGQELFIVYHTHYSTEHVGPRKLAIDRAKFVADPEGGPDRLVVDGPTVERQPMPK